MLLKDKIALITGASAGIGRACALLFASQGATVVLGARRQAELEALVAEIEAEGGKAVALAGDVRHESYARDLVSAAEEQFGGLDIALNNAGTLGAMGDCPDIPLVGWQDTLETNLTSAFLGAKHQLPALENRSGSLIFTSSFVGHTVGMPGMAAYGASKAGMIGLSQCLAAEYGPKGVRVNALLPGGTDTDMGRVVANSPDMREFVASLHALKRMATPEEIAQTALFLASEASSFVTGQALLADGGVSINRV
ncbi:SDR family oxidoreductase [Rhodovibrionaceae bacterium A322]